MAKLVKSETSGGWGRGSGYARYQIGSMRWGIEAEDGYIEHFVRKCDAVAAFEFVQATGFDFTKGDLEIAWRNWCFENGKKMPEGYRGRI